MKRYLVGEHFYDRHEAYAGIVYYIKNKVNGKGYVGQTTLPFNLRWAVHVSDARNGHDNLFSRAINKYGQDAFEPHIIAYCGTQFELDAAEAAFIRGFGTLALEGGGYNVAVGGFRTGRHTQCKRGHSLLDPDNIHIDGSGCRRCLICLRSKRRNDYKKKIESGKERERQYKRSKTPQWKKYQQLYCARRRAFVALEKGIELTDLQKEALKTVVGNGEDKISPKFSKVRV